MACGCGKKRAAARAAGEAVPPARRPAPRSGPGAARYLVTNGEDPDQEFTSLVEARDAARRMVGRVEVLQA